MERVGKLYQFTADEKSLKQIFPNGVAGDIQEQWTLTGNTGMLVRPLGVQLVQHLENWRQATARKLAAAGSAVKDVDVTAPYTPAGPAADSKDPLRTFRALRLLTGARGSGKSQLLNYAVQYARRNGWIVLFVPDSFEVMHLGRALQRSKRRPGMADQNDIAMKILQVRYPICRGTSCILICCTCVFVVIVATCCAPLVTRGDPTRGQHCSSACVTGSSTRLTAETPAISYAGSCRR